MPRTVVIYDTDHFSSGIIFFSQTMCGSRKFYHRGSNSDVLFLLFLIDGG